MADTTYGGAYYANPNDKVKITWSSVIISTAQTKRVEAAGFSFSLNLAVSTEHVGVMANFFMPFLIDMQKNVLSLTVSKNSFCIENTSAVGDTTRAREEAEEASGEHNGEGVDSESSEGSHERASVDEDSDIVSEDEITSSEERLEEIKREISEARSEIIEQIGQVLTVEMANKLVHIQEIETQIAQKQAEIKDMISKQEELATAIENGEICVRMGAEKNVAAMLNMQD